MRHNRLLLGAFIGYSAFAQGTVSVDLLDPSETSGTIPANLRIVDVFVEIATTDVWTAAGVFVQTHPGAVFAYDDADGNVPGVQPGLFNPGLADQFLTSLSKPRGRDTIARFTNAGAAAAGSYSTPSPTPSTLPTSFDVAYFNSPPEVTPWWAVSGYIARISVDVSSVPGVADHPGNADWFVGSAAPAGATVVLSSAPFDRPIPAGTVIATFDVPAIRGIDWQLWFVPEPRTFLILCAPGLLMFAGRRNSGGRSS